MTPWPFALTALAAAALGRSGQRGRRSSYEGPLDLEEITLGGKLYNIEGTYQYQPASGRVDEYGGVMDWDLIPVVTSAQVWDARLNDWRSVAPSSLARFNKQIAEAQHDELANAWIDRR